MYHFNQVILFLGFIILCKHMISGHSELANDLTLGFTQLPFDNAHYINHSPYNLPLAARYSFIDGVHKLWVFHNDEPFSRGSPTFPRSELSINGYKYSMGVWQFQAYVFVPQGTTGVSLMQVFGGDPYSTTLMVRVYNGDLYYYREKVIVQDIYDKWFRLNVIHDVEGNSVEVYIDGILKFKGHGRGGTIHYFKCGVYGQVGDSVYMESQWKNIKIFKKSN